jgi:ribosomal protein S18 acetylase RimI-like enzyme
MTREDYGFAVTLTDSMDWNMVESDFEFMMELEKDGCFVAFDGSERVGISNAIKYSKIGWIGNVIVSKKSRKKGFGSLLVKHCKQYLMNKGAESIGLYSYTNRIQFYEKLGFNRNLDFIVFEGKASSVHSKTRTRVVDKSDIPDIVKLDTFCFGSSRKKLLESLLNNPDNLYFVPIDKGKFGFIISKVFGNYAEVGPMVCFDKRVASDLLIATLNNLVGFNIFLCLPKREFFLTNLFSKFGLNKSFQVSRMFFGNHLSTNCFYLTESLERG